MQRVRRSIMAVIARALIAVVRRLPLGLAQWMGDRLGGLGYWVSRKEARRAVEHLAFAFPDRPAAWHRRTARQVFRNAGRIAAEYLVLLRWTPEQRLQRILVNPEEFRAQLGADARGGGLAGITSHFGSWEVLGAVGPAVCALTVVARRPNDPRMAKLADEMRKATGAAVVYSDESMRPLFRAIRDGGAIAILADQDLRRMPGIFVPFFGREAYTVTSPVQIAQATGGVLRIYLARREGRRYRILWSHRIDPGTKAEGEAALRRATAEWTAYLEAAIRAHPDQWMWMHRRWRTRPEDIAADTAAPTPATP